MSGVLVLAAGGDLENRDAIVERKMGDIGLVELRKRWRQWCQNAKKNKRYVQCGAFCLRCRESDKRPRIDIGSDAPKSTAGRVLQ